jgi:hypothetical protein
MVSYGIPKQFLFAASGLEWSPQSVLSICYYRVFPTFVYSFDSCTRLTTNGDASGNVSVSLEPISLAQSSEGLCDDDSIAVASCQPCAILFDSGGNVFDCRGSGVELGAYTDNVPAPSQCAESTAAKVVPK